MTTNTANKNYDFSDENSLNEWRKENLLIEEKEPLFNTPKRDSLYPIQYKGIWEYYKLHLSSFWVADEIDLSKDVNDWNNLNDDEKHYIKYGLAFFAGSDFIINESQEKDRKEIELLEYKFFNDDKMARENIHSITYANLLETYIRDDKEREMLKNSVKEIDTIKQKAEWMRNYIANGTSIERVVAESIMEGIFFSGTFASIFWLKKRGLMPGLADSNEMIARDEGLHRDFNCYLYRELIENKLPVDLITKMIKDAVSIEKKFVCESLPVRLIGMNNEMMCQYIEYVADHLAVNLGLFPIFDKKNPFEDWMSNIALKVKADFFVHRPTSYAKSSVLVDKEENKITFDDMSF